MREMLKIELRIRFKIILREKNKKIFDKKKTKNVSSGIEAENLKLRRTVRIFEIENVGGTKLNAQLSRGENK